ncbi:MAG: c-type cytochrome [Akkermansiaceae bacterium]
MKHSHRTEDAGEDYNVREKHGQIWREYSEPSEIYNAIPGWLKHGIYAPLFMWAIWYMCVYSGGFKSDEYYEGFKSQQSDVYEPATQHNSKSPLSDSGPTLADQMKTGKKIYTSVCSSCHQPEGQGMPGVFPPLAGSDWLQKDKRLLSAIILHGLTGEIMVNGTAYNGNMPPWGEQLDDAKLAAVLTYIRSEWGDKKAAVEPSTVSAVRENFSSRSPWTEPELNETFSD